MLCSGDYRLVGWGCICGQRRTDRIVIDRNLTAHRYINQILRPVLLPFLQNQPRLLVQQDNARPRTVLVVHQFFAANNVNILPWPARSPDLSPIEHWWNHLGQRIRHSLNHPMNRDGLVQAIRQDWRAISDAVIRRLTNSLRRRVHTCIFAHGGHTRY